MTLSLLDSCGDGWEGSTYDVRSLVDGLRVANGTLDDGSSGDVLVHLDGGTCYGVSTAVPEVPPVSQCGVGSIWYEDNQVGWQMTMNCDGECDDGDSRTQLRNGGAPSYMEVCTGVATNGTANTRFVQPPCAGKLFEFDMVDDFGDGWNGNLYALSQYVHVDEEGASALSEPVASGSLYDGSSGERSFCIRQGVIYNLVVGGGDYLSEVSWRLGSLEGGAPEQLSFELGSDGTSMHVLTPPTYDNSVTCARDGDKAYNLVMYDDFGDGWGDGTLAVWDLTTGVQVGADGMPDGSTQSSHVCMTEGDCYTVATAGDAFAYESSWMLGSISGGVPEAVDFCVGDDGNFDRVNCRAGHEYALTMRGLWLKFGYSQNYGWAGWSWHIVEMIPDDAERHVRASGALEYGYGQQVDVFCLPDGCYEMLVGGGLYDEQMIEWQLGSIVGSVGAYFFCLDDGEVESLDPTPAPTSHPTTTATTAPSATAAGDGGVETAGYGALTVHMLVLGFVTTTVFLCAACTAVSCLYMRLRKKMYKSRDQAALMSEHLGGQFEVMSAVRHNSPAGRHGGAVMMTPWVGGGGGEGLPSAPAQLVPQAREKSLAF